MAGKTITPKDIFRAFQGKVDDDPQGLLHLARVGFQAGKNQEAFAQLRRAVALSGDDKEIAARARTLIAGTVPAWHFSIVKDQVRNDAYDAALRRAIKPGMRVLEIGTGSGILAMMAARAGAEVVTCEMNPAVAEAAQQVISANGYDDRIRVVPKKSDLLDVEADLGGRMDLLVSEIVSNDLLGQNILHAHRHAVRELLKPGATVIPASGSLVVALANVPAEGKQRIGAQSGFDLGAFNSLRERRQLLPSDKETLALRSDSADLFHFDFGHANFPEVRRIQRSVTALGGKVNGIVQWIRLNLNDQTAYENSPDSGFGSCWAQMFHPLPTPIQTEPGQAFTISGWHNHQQVEIWLN